MPRWIPGPPLNASGGLDAWYDPYEWLARGPVDSAGRFYFIPQGTANCMARLDPPYTSWFSMWCNPYQAMDEFGDAHAQGADKLIVWPQAGSGAARYDRDEDDGDDTFLDSGPWEDNFGNYHVAATPVTWLTMIGGMAESAIAYGTSCKDQNERIYIFPRDSNDSLQIGTRQLCGYLDPDAAHFIQIAKMPSRDIGDPTKVAIEAHASCADARGRIYVAGGLGTDGELDNFRRYDPGPPVGPGIQDVQRIEVTEPGWSPGSSARVRIARDLGTELEWQYGDSEATIQGIFDAKFGAGVVVIEGTYADFTVTGVEPGVRPVLTNGGSGGFADIAEVTVTVLQRGTGGPSVDAWEELDPLPTPAYVVTLVAFGADIYALGGFINGPLPAGLAHRWREGEGWTAIHPMATGYALPSYYSTSGQAQPAFVYQGFILVLGYNPDLERTALMIYDPGSDHWIVPIVCGTGHERGAFAVTGDYAIVAGGYDRSTNTITTDVEIMSLTGLNVPDVETYVAEWDTPNVPITVLQSPKAKTWQDLLSDAGSGSLTLELDDPDLTDVTYQRVICFSYKGEPAFTMVCEKSERVILERGEEAVEAVAWSGRGSPAQLERMLIYPTGGVGRAPIEDDRFFNWTSLGYDDSLWDPGFAVSTVGVAQYAWAHGFVPWPAFDATAEIIWDTDGTVDGAIPGTVYVRQSITVAGSGPHQLHIMGDNEIHVYVDGQFIGSYIGPTGDPLSFSPVVVDLDLSAGTHVVAFRIISYAFPTPPGFQDFNPAGGAWALYQLDPGVATLVTHSLAADAVMLRSTTVPGMSIGKVIQSVVAEGQARGVLPDLFLTFDDFVDSNGEDWPITADIATKVGTDLLTFLRELAVTYIEFWMDPWTQTLNCVNIGTAGSTPGVTFQEPTDETDPSTGNITGLITHGEG